MNSFTSGSSGTISRYTVCPDGFLAIKPPKIRLLPKKSENAIQPEISSLKLAPVRVGYDNQNWPDELSRFVGNSKISKELRILARMLKIQHQTGRLINAIDQIHRTLKQNVDINETILRSELKQDISAIVSFLAEASQKQKTKIWISAGFGAFFAFVCFGSMSLFANKISLV